MRRVFDLQHGDRALRQVAIEVPTQHLAELRIVVKRERRAMRADEALAGANEVEQVLLLRLGETEVAVGHHHHAVELRQVVGREEREVVLFGIELVALERRDFESAGLAQFGDRLLRRSETRVFVEARMSQKEQFFWALRRQGKRHKAEGKKKRERKSLPYALSLWHCQNPTAFFGVASPLWHV